MSGNRQTGLCSVAVLGPEVWQAYFRQNFTVTRSYLERGSGLFTVMAPSAFMAMRLYGAQIWAAYAVQLMSGLIALIGGVLAWRSSASFDQKVGITGVATLLATPYAYNYDMTMVSVGVLAGAALCRDEQSSAIARVLTDVIWVLPVVIMPLHHARVIIAPWVLLAFFGWLLMRMGAWNPQRWMIRYPLQ